MYAMDWRQYMPDIGRWGVVDPLAEKYYQSTPYAYVLGNPISNYDPDGMQVENDYKLLKNGDVKLIKETNDKSDTLYATDDKGKVDSSNSVTVQKEKSSDGSIISGLANNAPVAEKEFSSGVNYGTTTNVNDALNVFSFAAKNSNVEWGLNGTTSNYTAFTGHEAALTPTYFFNQNIAKNIFEIHSHKNLNRPSQGPGGGVNDDYTAAFYGNLAYKKAVGTPQYYPVNYMLYAPNKGAMQLWKYWSIPMKGKTGLEAGTGSKSMGTFNQLTLKALGL